MTNLFIAFQALLPQHALSRSIGFLAVLERPVWLKNVLIRLFKRIYGISLAEAEGTAIEDYRHFNHFFTRALAADARPLGKADYVSPADGKLSQCGAISEGQMLQAKGHWYSVESLLAGSALEAQPFIKGSFATVYLSPRDYHRIHMPVSGILRSTRYVPGALFAVNETTTEGVQDLFAKNERLVCLFDTADGPLALVLVGALIVAGIETVWGGVETPDPGTPRERHWDAAEAPTLAAGDEVGRFFLGSTVIMLTGAAALQWHKQAGDSVQVRESLADKD